MKPIYRTQQAPNDIWEKFAEADPYTYILTDLKNPDPKKFWESGERTVKEELLPLIRERGIRRQIGLELGCGVGRLLFPMAREFEEVVGVDIAEGMVRRAVSYAGDNGIRNVALAAISGPEDLLHKAGEYAGKVDFLYSLLVFQHIPDFAVIEGYLHAVSELLEENGIAYLQFDTREQTLLYQCKTELPDFVLPRFWRRGIRRIRRSSAELEVCFRRAGLEIVDELNPHSAYHRYILRKTRMKSATP
jgi:cyclopropane fatty-acyl-phospholipid synthase-like methyltransferase